MALQQNAQHEDGGRREFAEDCVLSQTCLELSQP